MNPVSSTAAANEAPIAGDAWNYAAENGAGNSGAAGEDPTVLHDHLLRVQTTLLDAVEHQMKSIQNNLENREFQMQDMQVARNNMATELTKTKLELGKLNSFIHKLMTRVRESDSKARIVSHEREILKKETELHQSEAKRLQQDLQETKRLLEESIVEKQQLVELNKAFHSNVKVQKCISNKIEQELESEETLKKALEKQVEGLNRKLKRTIQENRELQQDLRSQKNETEATKINVRALNQEILQVREEKERLEKRWEESVFAMSKRDAALQHTFESQEDLKIQVKGLLGENHRLQALNETHEFSIVENNTRIEFLEKTLVEHRAHIQRLDRRNETVQETLLGTKIEESDSRAKNEKLRQQLSVASQEVERQQMIIDKLRAQLETWKKREVLRLKEEGPDANGWTPEQKYQMQEAIDAAVERTKKEMKGDAVELKHQNVLVTRTSQDQQQELEELRSDKAFLERESRLVDNTNVHLTERVRHLEHDAQRKEHDVNNWKVKYEELEAANNAERRRINIEIGNYQRTIAASRSENDRLQRLWMKGQQDLIQCQEECNQLQREHQFMKTQAGVGDTQRMRMEQDLEESKKETMDERFSTNKFWIELRKYRNMAEELRQKNLNLETELAEMQARLQMSHVDKDSQVSMLRLEVKRAYEETKELRKLKDMDEKSMNVEERKMSNLQVVAQKLKKENHELKMQNFNLNSRLTLLQKKHEDLMKQFRRWTESVSKVALQRAEANLVKGEKAQAGANNGMSLPPIHPAQQPKGRMNTGSDVRPNSTSAYEITDVSSLKLRIHTLTSEKDYLLNDNTLMKARLADLTTATQKLERRLKQTTEKNKHWEKEYRANQETLRLLAERFYRAEKIAAFLEKQYREAAPHAKLDYSQLDQMLAANGNAGSASNGAVDGAANRLEPSIPLLAAMSSKAKDPLMNIELKLTEIRQMQANHK